MKMVHPVPGNSDVTPLPERETLIALVGVGGWGGQNEQKLPFSVGPH